ncbi:serine/threonine-protein phosphatase [bacterium]|nr:serine/threonine-protein phosphatase [bacterium]
MRLTRLSTKLAVFMMLCCLGTIIPFLFVCRIVEKSERFWLWNALLVAAGLALLFLICLLIARKILKPLYTLIRNSRLALAGKLEGPLPESDMKGEIGDLARDFEKLRHALKSCDRRLGKAEEAKKRIEGELKVAFDIQHSLLPKLDRVNSGDDRIRLAGKLQPAMTVGGDLYNAFFVDRSHLCVCMGDVSGKGISAALFMGVVQTLVRSVARYNASPAAILDHVNKDRSANNEGCMFVTLFCAVINMRTGTMAYCNGGHNPPLIIRRDGQADFVASHGGALVGMSPLMTYQDDYMVLKPGDTLFLYTDGVTEAFQKSGAMYSDERLKSFLQNKNALSCEDIVEGVWKDVETFVGDAPQSDDIAMLTVRYLGK